MLVSHHIGVEAWGALPPWHKGVEGSCRGLDASSSWVSTAASMCRHSRRSATTINRAGSSKKRARNGAALGRRGAEAEAWSRARSHPCEELGKG